MRRSPRPGGDFLQGELAAGLEHPAHLAVEAVAVGDIHRGILRPHDIETHILERQVERIALPVIDPADEAGQAGQHLRDANELGGQIDAADTAAIMPGEIARRTTEPRADIEHPLASSEADELGEPHRRRPLAAVKLVDGCEVVGRQMVEVLSGGL
jgi:hypothetical protein